MARILITGSSDGLGLMAGRLLAGEGHAVVLHARNEVRAADAWRALPDAESVIVGDVSVLAAMRDVAAQANATGRFDAVIHNVGLGYREPDRTVTEDGLSRLWAVNVLAPYVLTALMRRPDRLVYLSSGMHTGAGVRLDDVQWEHRRWDGAQAYSETKLHDVWLAFGIARLWPDVPSNAVSPGWVATCMGGWGANDDLDQAHRTQAWLAAGNDPDARMSGRYLYHRSPGRLSDAASDQRLQDDLLAYCASVAGIALPNAK